MFLYNLKKGHSRQIYREEGRGVRTTSIIAESAIRVSIGFVLEIPLVTAPFLNYPEKIWLF